MNVSEITNYVEKNIDKFHVKKIESLEKLSLKKVLKRKNPYLYKAKNVITSAEIVNGIVDAHISSNEETIFGDWMEDLAIYINSTVYGGKKSGIEGIDLEFDHDNKRFLVAIKSGPNWGNSTQITKLKEYFLKAARTLRTSNSGINIVAINGCCYGIDNNPDKGGYFKYCGQRFWEFISGDADLYAELIEPLGHQAKERNDEFQKAYTLTINKFIKQFSEEYCDSEGNIDWVKILDLNSKGS